MEENITIAIEDTLGINNTENTYQSDTNLYNSNEDSNINNEPLIEPLNETMIETMNEPLNETSEMNLISNDVVHVNDVDEVSNMVSISNNILTEIENINNLPIEKHDNIKIIPKLVFIVPYRDRKQHYEFFSNHMKQILQDEKPYKIAYIHQKDERLFNRGAMKNIGFLIIKELYPNHYKDITFVFNDIDTMPYTKNFLNYNTTHGIIKHFYGYTWCLGGIVSITGGDFEKINGFPNFWAWGYEDNLLNIRAIHNNILIDRSQFYPIMDKNILQLKDGILRIVNRSEFEKYIKNTNEGITTISNIKYENDIDIPDFYNVSEFLTGTVGNITSENESFNITKSNTPFFIKPIRKTRMPMVMM